MPGEKKYEVVISGLSGQYPECEDVDELWDRLMNKEDMVTIDGRRWSPGEFDVPAGTGKIPHPEYFDMTFFGIHRRLCEKMDPSNRLLCAEGYKAVCDAGVNPRDLEGTNTAVIMCSVDSEPELDSIDSSQNQGAYSIMALSRTMQANRLSYFLDLKGPSFQTDDSSFGAIRYACDLISNGACTAAIVGACSMLFKGEGSFHYQMMGRLSEDCKTRSFSSDAAGFARSEGCVTVFLQRKEHAKRIYGTILGANVLSPGSKEAQFPGFPRELYDQFLVETYRKAKVDPKDLVYVEAHGAASRTLDALELNGLSKALLKQRSEPLPIGSIRSNLGHAEGASSMISLTKALMALDRGIIPPNINYREPNPEIPDLVSGKLKVVTEPTQIAGGTVAVCELGVTGSLGHIILKGNEKVKIPEIKDGGNKLPHLLIMSGRNGNVLEKNMTHLEKTGIDEEVVLLLNSLYKEGIRNHIYRGYSVTSTGEPNNYNMIGPAPGGKRRAIWFMYSGMGSQWPTMAKTLMALPPFANAIHRCQKILEPKGINLLDIVCKDDPTIFDSILNSFVGISAVQIGLTDVIKAIGIEPDGIIGHSVGELGCAYADGCMTAEQMILAAHARGRASVEAKLIKGMMAAVGAGYNQMKNIIPDTIEVACHNSKDSCTLSGPADDMAVFIAQLKAKGMFAKLVNVANIAYHSQHIKPAAPALLKYLKEILPVPVKRSAKWVSTSNMECNWDTNLSQHSSAEYHTNNLLSSVLFEEASSHIPSDAIVIEIAPHGLLQAIVKRSLPQAVHIPLTSRFDQNNLMFLLSALGKMFMAGIPLDLHALYPNATFPVSRGTPGISPMIDWSRDEKFPVKRVTDDPEAPSPLSRLVSVDRLHDDYGVFSSQKIYRKSVIPTSFYFNEMIDHFTKLKSNDVTPIVMEKVRFLGYSEVQAGTSTVLRFQLLQGRGNIVVSNNVTTEILLECNIKATDADTVKGLTAPEANIEDIEGISHDEMVSFMRTFGVIRDSSLISLNNIINVKEYFLCTVRWEGDIGKFLTSLLALIEFIETKSSYVLKLFHSAGEIMINLPFLHKSKAQDFIVEYDLLNRTLRCEGVRIARIECQNPGLSQNIDKNYIFSFELPQFMPYINNSLLSHRECANMCIQLILENTLLAGDTIIKITEIGTNTEIHDVLEDISESLIYAGHMSLSSFPTEESFQKECSSTLLQKDMWVVCAEPPSPATVQSILSIRNGFVLSPKDETLEKAYQVVFETQADGKWYTLYAIRKPNMRQYKVVKLNSDYLQNLEIELLRAGSSGSTPDNVKTVILWGQVDSIVEVDHIVEETKGLPNSEYLHYWLFHGKAPEVSFSQAEFKSQFERDVRMNISKDGKWGSLRLIPSSARGGPHDSFKPSKFYYPLSAVAASHNIFALGLSFDYNSVDMSVSKLGAYDYVSSNKNMGIGTYDPNSKTFTHDPILNWRKPTQWTSKEAATVPLLYSLASYILHQIHKCDELAEGETILVNRGLLPLSQAVISLALYENKKVHATVYGEKEKQKLLSLFPKLNPSNIYDCSTVSFFAEVLRNTGGGVYKVINNFDDPVMIEPCAKCTLPFGVLIYASQSLINNGALMGMLRFLDNIIAKSISEDILMNSSNDVKIGIKNNIAKALQGGGVVPIRATSFLPPSTLNTEAAKYLKSNSNKVVVETPNIETSIFLQDDSRTQVIVEGNIQVDLNLNIIEWLLKRGSRRILLFSRQSHLLEVNSLRLQSLREQYKSAVIEVRPSNQLSTKLQVEECIKECSSRSPAIVFFLGSGLKERMEFFGEVLSRGYPKWNMICIGEEGESVCDRRMKNTRLTLYIRCSTDNMEGANLVHYLDSLIEDSSRAPVVLVKKYAIQSRSLHGLIADLKNMPDTRDDLFHLMSQCQVSAKAKFVDIPSAGPYVHQNREVYPMFLISGLRPDRLRKMASQLFCPTMEARIPTNASTIDQIANELADQLLVLPHKMFTICAEGWGGILGLHVAGKLKEKSKYVNLILLDASPASIVKWADSLLRNDVALIRKYLQIPPGIESNMKNYSWDEELKFAIEHSPLGEEDTSSIFIDCLNLLRRRLLSVVDAKPPSEKLNIICHVFGLQSQAHEDHGLGDYLLKEPVVHTKDSKTADEMIVTDVAMDVNSLLLYEHKDAANPPIEEYLGCNIIKNNSPSWLGSRLVRGRQ